MEITFKSSVAVRTLEFLASPYQPAQPALQIRNFVQIGEKLLLLTIGLWILFLIDRNDIVISSNVLAVGSKFFGKLSKIDGSALKQGSQPMIKVTPVDEDGYSFRGGHFQTLKKKQGVRVPNPLELINPPLISQRRGGDTSQS